MKKTLKDIFIDTDPQELDILFDGHIDSDLPDDVMTRIRAKVMAQTAFKPSKRKKSKLSKRNTAAWIAFATCLAVLVTAIPIGMFFANREDSEVTSSTDQKTVSETPSHEAPPSFSHLAPTAKEIDVFISSLYLTADGGSFSTNDYLWKSNLLMTSDGYRILSPSLESLPIYRLVPDSSAYNSDTIVTQNKAFSAFSASFPNNKYSVSQYNYKTLYLITDDYDDSYPKDDEVLGLDFNGIYTLSDAPNLSADDFYTCISPLISHIKETFGFQSFDAHYITDIYFSTKDDALFGKQLSVWGFDRNGFLDHITFTFERLEDGRYILTDIRYKYPNIAESEEVELIGEDAARELLYKGYAFGISNVCPICFPDPGEIAFDDNSECMLMYFRDYTSKCDWLIPFYAFSEPINNTMCGVVFVPAIEIEGYEEYFEKQHTPHDN